MTMLISNWQLIVAIVVIAAAAITWCYKFLNLSPAEKKKEITTILVNLTYEAEKILGSKTGSVKRSYVYNAFKKSFPFLASITSMEMFDKLLDEALKAMKDTFNSIAEEQN